MASRFLYNGALWDELTRRVAEAKRVCAAVAYMGSEASKLLPLKKGDKLVVDMSLRAVKCGATDPREVRKLLRRGVEVYSRESLHAKFFITGRVVIAGSANGSKHSRDSLDEAAILTADPATVRRATATFDQLCTEPVRKDYLEKCIKEYRAPVLPRTPSRSGKQKAAKLWLIGGLSYRDLPEEEQARADTVAKTVTKKLLDYERSEVDYAHYPKKQGFFGHLRQGDWLVVCTREGKGFDVAPPARFLGIEAYPRGHGTRRYLLLYEKPSRGASIRWSQFRRVAPSSLPAARGNRPRTYAVEEHDVADAILRLWDSRGRFRGRRA
jgi:hypothetical protein